MRNSAGNLSDRRKPLVAGEKDYEEVPAGTRYDLMTRKRLEGK